MEKIAVVMTPNDELLRAKAQILDMLGGIEIRFSMTSQKWYATIHAEIKDHSILSGVCTHADTIESAVNGVFNQLTEGQPLIVTNALRDSRRHYRWNGFYFKEVPLTEQV